MIFRFRVTYEDHDDVFRDIEIKSTQSFGALNTAIQQAIAFDNTKSATFYASDDFWRKEAKIIVVNDKKLKTETTKVKNIAEFIQAPHQRFVYVFDPEREWTFNIELVKILPEEKREYPVCVKSSGTAPKQYKTTNLPPPEEENNKVSDPEVETDNYVTPISEEEKEEKNDDESVVPTLEQMDEEDIGESEDTPKDDEEGESSDGLTLDFDEEDLK